MCFCVTKVHVSIEKRTIILFITNLHFYKFYEKNGIKCEAYYELTILKVLRGKVDVVKRVKILHVGF